MRVRAGSGAVSGRDVFSSTADAELWVVDRDDPLLDRADPYARRVFRDSHPLDNDPTPPLRRRQRPADPARQHGREGRRRGQHRAAPAGAHLRHADARTRSAGSTTRSTSTASRSSAAAFAAGADPSKNNPPQPADRSQEFAVATYNVENLYDFRDDPFDGCDFTGNAGCPGVSPPFDYVPASEADIPRAAGRRSPTRSSTDLHAPDLILVQEAEDQDICTVSGGALSLRRHQQRRRRAGHAPGAGAGHGGGRRARRTPRPTTATAPTPAASPPPSCTAPTGCRWPPRRRPTRCWARRRPSSYRAAGLAVQRRRAEPEGAQRGAAGRRGHVDRRGRHQRLHPGSAGGQVHRGRGARLDRAVHRCGRSATTSRPARTAGSGSGGSRPRYGAAIVTAIEAADPTARVVYGGDLNVFPRPDDPIATGDSPTPVGPARPALRGRPAQPVGQPGRGRAVGGLLVQLRGPGPDAGPPVRQRRAATATWCRCGRRTSTPTGRPTSPATGRAGSSDHDPQVARFRSRASLTVADVTVAEGDQGTRQLDLHAPPCPGRCPSRCWSAPPRSASPRRRVRTTTAVRRMQDAGGRADLGDVPGDGAR